MRSVFFMMGDSNARVRGKGITRDRVSVKQDLIPVGEKRKNVI